MIKNSFRSSCNSSNNNTGGGGGTNAPLSAAYQSLNSSTGNNNYSTNLAGGETQVASVTTSAGFGGAQATQQQQPAPTSPGAVMDPFSLDYLYALNHSLDCPQHPNYHQQFHHHSHHNHHQHHHSFHGHKSARPRSRSGSSGLVASSVGGGGGGGGGMGPTMARMFDMFRGRSNSIAASTVASEGGCNCNSVSPFCFLCVCGLIFARERYIWVLCYSADVDNRGERAISVCAPTTTICCCCYKKLSMLSFDVVLSSLFPSVLHLINLRKRKVGTRCVCVCAI